MAAEYYTILTNDGIAYETDRKAKGLPIKLAKMSVGDGGGSVYNPDARAKALKREVWRGDINSILQDADNPSWLVLELTLPDDVGGFYVREAGVWTDTGILYAILKYPESYKPVAATSGSGKEFYLKAIFQTSNAANVVIQVDESIVKATRTWVADYVAQELAKLDSKQSVRAATTANITLSGTQTVDGVILVIGDRVLVKNQKVASQNGIYIVSVGAWKRAPDADASIEVTPQLTVGVEQGSINADTFWFLQTDAPIVLGTTALMFQQIYTAPQVDGLLSSKADSASPNFTGEPKAPTAAVGTNTDQLATMRAIVQGLSAFGLTADKSTRPADLDALRGTRFFGFTHWTVGAPVESGPYDAVGFQIESYGQRTQFAVSGGSKFQIRTDDSEDYSGFDTWTELSTVNALSALADKLTAQLELKAPSASPDLTGKPTVPTPAKGNKSKLIANTEYVQTEIAALIDSSPGALDTLRELAAALGNDPNFASTIVGELGKKANTASPTFTGEPKAPTAPVGTNTDQLATMKALLQALGAFGLTSGRSTFVDDLNVLRGTCFFGFGEKATGAVDTGGVYDAIGFQVESIGQRTQFAVPGGAKLWLRTDDTNDASGFEPWVEMASLNALNVLAEIVAGKAPIASPKFTGLPEVPTAGKGANTAQAANAAFVQREIGAVVDSAPSALDTLKKIAVSLDNDPNFAGTAMKLLGLKAPLASPKFTGLPEAPTAGKGTNSDQVATTAFVQAAVAALIDSAPGALDSLRELASALGNDPNFATTVLNELSRKANLVSPKLTGSPEAPTAAVGTNTDQIATMKAVLQGLASFGLSTVRSSHVGDLDSLRGTSFYGYTNNSVGAEVTSGGYDAIGFQIEGPGQRTQFGVGSGARLAIRTDDSNDYSGFSAWVEMATVEALKALEDRDSGMVGHFALPTPPRGWLKRNGAAVSRTTYALLFSRIGTKFGEGDGSTTFNLPDDRELVDKAWTDGLNAADPGRELFSTQAGQNEEHTHTGTIGNGGAHQHSTQMIRERITSEFIQQGGNAVFGDQMSDGVQSLTTSVGGAHTHTLSISSSGGSEVRVANRAYLACIKY